MCDFTLARKIPKIVIRFIYALFSKTLKRNFCLQKCKKIRLSFKYFPRCLGYKCFYAKRKCHAYSTRLHTYACYYAVIYFCDYTKFFSANQNSPPHLRRACQSWKLAIIFTIQSDEHDLQFAVCKICTLKGIKNGSSH